MLKRGPEFTIIVKNREGCVKISFLHLPVKSKMTRDAQSRMLFLELLWY